eukprot:GEMP01032629.1.p1 GENE.GEMP01032629.1~~GEMP01032629.1.p1  ORF type:complete len:522 (+),score=117.83 GEMP01032629.1:94-1659(+)
MATTEDPVDFFIEHWGLDEISQKVIRRAATSTQSDIMAKFRPKDSSRNCNALFMAFVKSLSREDPVVDNRSVGGQPDLTTTSYGALPVDPTIIPAPTATNMGYVGGYPGTVPFAPQPAQHTALTSMSMMQAPTMPYMQPYPSVAMQQYVPAVPTVERTAQATTFLQQWNLNMESINFLDSLSLPVQDEVIKDFTCSMVYDDPAHDVNRAFLRFARERTIKVFIEQWQLNEQSWGLLLSLPPDHQVLVMATFNPTDLTNLNVQFQTFATTCQAMAVMSAGVDPVTMHAFQQRWQLSDENMRVLQSLDPALQVEIVSAFAPRDLTRDANGMFRSFLNSRRDGKTRIVPAPYVTPMDASVGASVGCDGNAPGLEYFIQQWKLDQASVGFLNGLNAPTQADIMSSFSPKDSNRDCNGIFMSFARSRLSGSRSPGMLHGLQAMQNAQLSLGTLSAESPMDVETFVSSWALNSISAELLKELTPETRQMIMNEFRPHDIFRDVNSVFQSFVRSRGCVAPEAKRMRYS